MRVRGLCTVVLCVFCVACVSVEGLSSEEERIIGSARTSAPRTFYIYPRSGRLFHADYVRDNEVFRSLERTNFMRRGRFADAEELTRTKRDDEVEAVTKKHTYVDAGRIPGGKKSVKGKVREGPFKVLTKLSAFMPKDSEEVGKRVKRETTVSREIEKDKVVSTQKEQMHNSDAKLEEFEMVKPEENHTDVSTVKVNEGSVTKETENKVEGEHNTHTKNTDTDKTLFVLDSALKTDQSSEDFHVPELEALQEDRMEKRVLDDGMRLYPVYKGVKYVYPRIERSLQYAPAAVVQMDQPEVKDYDSLSDTNSTAAYQEEGRGRRRRIKKLAFPLLLALKLKAAVMLPLILGLISLVAFKGLWSGLTALGVAAALGLKALVGSGAPRVVVQAPPLPSPHYHHPPPHEYAEYWSRRDDFSDYRPSSWS